MFVPFYEFYYDGPMGNYGVNLKKRHAGYTVRGAAGLTRAIELQEITTSMITTPTEFRQFIKNTPVKTRAIAIVDYNSVMLSPLDNSDDNNNDHETFYTVLYEKREHSDVLYLYTSLDITVNSHLSNYFRPDFLLCTPYENGRILEQNGLTELFALKDAKNLQLQLAKPITSDVPQQKFYLSESFLYSAYHSVQDYMKTMVNALAKSSNYIHSP